MARHAIIDPNTNKVVNVVIWEGAEWLPPTGYVVLQADICDIDDDYDPEKQAIIRKDRTEKN